MGRIIRNIVSASLSLLLASACGGSPSSSASGGTAGGPVGAWGGGSSAGAGGALNAGGGSNGLAGSPAEVGPQLTSNKLDVLFVIDNSLSMAGKQKILVNSLAGFISQLTNPPCVDAQGKATALQPALPGDACASGKRLLTPLTDIHFGAVTTSLGGHGGKFCLTSPSDDQAQLIPSKRAGVSSYQDTGYLAFDATGKAGVSSAAAIAADLKATILAAGETGCGFEAPLEAMYRFLVDPEPPLAVELVEQTSTPTGINETLLKQRNSFLRPDSSVAVVILSDENDCSILDSSYGWLVASVETPMPRATSACETNPNDACCRSCAEAKTPAGCAPAAEDSDCKNVTAGDKVARWDALHDSANLRCYDQQRRFGFDLLRPLSTYSNGLTNARVPNRAGMLVDNPLLAARDGKGPRSPSLISVSFIIGVPWQDLATQASLSSEHELAYLDSAGLEAERRWPLLLGDPARNVPPSDPFMQESVEPRAGMNPLTGTPISAATSLNPQANAINGHELQIANRNDLQYACTFALPEPINCAVGEICECAADKQGSLAGIVSTNSPLCQPPAGGPAGSTQYYGKGYPGTRELSLARQLGARAVVGSVCPRVSNDLGVADFGYKPLLDALLRRIALTVR